MDYSFHTDQYLARIQNMWITAHNGFYMEMLYMSSVVKLVVISSL